MTAAILSLLAPLLSSPTLLAILGGVIAVVGAFIKGRLDGAKKERARQAEQEIAARDIRDQVQNDIGAMPADKVRDELARRAAK